MNTVLPPARVSFHRPEGGFAGSPADPLAVELAFTRVYRENQYAGAALRELRCLEVLLPARFQPPLAGDRFAGRIRLPYCGFAPQASGPGGGGGFAYYCNRASVERVLAATPGDAAWRAEVAEMLAFWATENTDAKTRAALPPEVDAALLSDDLSYNQPNYALYRFAGTQLDYAKLVRLGLPGLRAEVERAFADRDPALGEAFSGALRLLGEVAERHAADLCDSGSPAALAVADANERERMVAALDFIPHRAPETFREAIQLIWLTALASGSLNYGRLDEVLGGFLARDLDAGLLDEEAATDLLVSWWRLMDANTEIWNHRVIVGGRGRTCERDADRFALLAMEASRRVRLVTPQLTLRFHAGQNPALMEKALTVLGEGVTFPMLYNDDVNVPAVMEAMAVPEADALDYLPFGCGEYILWRKSVGTPSGAINVAKCLELALNDGHCLLTGKLMGPRTGSAANFTTFEELWSAFVIQVDHGVHALARLQKIEYEVGAREAAFLYISLLMDDCLATGKTAGDGGVRYLGGTLETYGNIDVGDAFLALRRAVFDDKIVALPELVAALRRDWRGPSDEALRERLLALPKFGNDDDEADAMAMRVHDYLANTIRDQARVVGLHHYLMVVINNSMNVDLGRMTSALPDGRRAGEPLANGNNPVAGRDRQGVTAFMQSLVKLRPDRHAGAVHNMKFSRGLFTRSRAKLEALLAAYWAGGGAQAMITVVNRGDLEAAMLEPAKWAHLIVRVGGFSARFIELPPDVQRHILARTLND